MEFVLHPNPDMGIYIGPSIDILYPDRLVEWAFPLTDDERSQAYIAWRDSQQ